MNSFSDDARQSGDTNKRINTKNKLAKGSLSKQEMIDMLVFGNTKPPVEEWTEKQIKDIDYLTNEEEAIISDFWEQKFKYLDVAVNTFKMQEDDGKGKKNTPIKLEADNDIYVNMLGVLAKEVFENSNLNTYIDSDRLQEIKEEAMESCSDDLEAYDEDLSDGGSGDDLSLDDSEQEILNDDELEEEIDSDEHWSATDVRDKDQDEVDEEFIVSRFLKDAGVETGRADIYAKKFLTNISVDSIKIGIMIDNLSIIIKNDLKDSFLQQTKLMFREHFKKKEPLQYTSLKRIDHSMATITQLKFLLDNYDVLGCRRLFTLFNQPSDNRMRDDIDIMNKCKGKEVSELKAERADNMNYKIDDICYKYVMTPYEKMKIKRSWTRLGQYETRTPHVYEDENRLQGFLDNLK